MHAAHSLTHASHAPTSVRRPRGNTITVVHIFPYRTPIQRLLADLRASACRARWQVLRARGVRVVGKVILSPCGSMVIVARVPRENVLVVRTNPSTYTPDVA